VADNDEFGSKGHLLALSRAGRAAAQGLAAAPTLGVEEEFLLLDPVSGQVVPAAAELLGRLDGASWAKGELMRFQSRRSPTSAPASASSGPSWPPTAGLSPPSPSLSAVCWWPPGPPPRARADLPT